MSDSTSIPIVNEADEIIGYKQRVKITSDDVYRVSALWITNSKGEILLAQRGLKKSHDPGKWGPAVAGTVEKGESYDSNMLKEAWEEIGLKDFKFKKLQKLRRHTKYNYFSQYYLAVVDKEVSEFRIKEDEVNQLKWFAKAQLPAEILKNPEVFLPSVVWALEQLE